MSDEKSSNAILVEAESQAEWATQSLREAMSRAAADPQRPVYHFRPPAQWMNDPNGTIHHNGWYHLFYQHNPYAEAWGQIHWGHARSRDLVHWEHLPIALAPAEERGEAHCWSGCSWIDAQGRPMLFYTSLGTSDDRRDLDGAQQWAALGDADMMRWERHPDNPILTDRANGDVKIFDWRDPYMFKHQGCTYMILGGNLNRRAGGRGVVALYRAENAALTQWRFCGLPFEDTDIDHQQVDCPNLFPLTTPQGEEKWVLLFSPWHDSIQYYVGRFDPCTARFEPELRGKVDHAHDLFATNTLFDPEGRCILFAWVRGFKPEGRGWCGCMALPRVVSLSVEGELIQTPLPGLAQLRRRAWSVPPFELDGTSRLLPEIREECLELRVRFKPQGAASGGLRLRRSEDGCRSVEVRLDERWLHVAGTAVPWNAWKAGGQLDLHIFLDRSVIEVYAQDGRVSVTRVIDSIEDDVGVECFAEDGVVAVTACDAWPLKAEGLFSGP